MKITNKKLEKPNFLIAGAPRSGTGYVYHILDVHPDIYMAKPEKPEPKFFLVDEKYNKGIEYYLEKYFSNVVGKKAIGEKSTNYMENEFVPERIKRHLPEIKIIFLLRNPIDRAFSNYLWSKKNGLETLSFDDALINEKERNLKLENKYKYSMPFSYIYRGFYAKFIKRYLEHFNRNQILFLLYDDLLVDPKIIVGKLYQFLSVYQLIPKMDLNVRVNLANDGKYKMSNFAYNYLKEIYRQPNEELSKLIDLDIGDWNNENNLQRIISNVGA